MMAFRKWCARLGAMITMLSLAVLVPATAWAASGTGAVVLEAARRRSRGGGFGLLCCLLVLGVIALAIFLVLRSRRGRR